MGSDDPGRGLSRRDLLKVAGAGAATFAAVAGLPREAKASQYPEPTLPAEEYDIVIVGAGCGGLVSAIAATDQGGKAVVLEKMSRPAGNTIFAGGLICAVGTRFMAAQGIHEDVETFYKDLMEVSQQRGDPALTRLYAEKAGDGVHWLADVVGVQFDKIVEEIPPQRGTTHPVKGPLRPGGAQLQRDLLNAAAKRNIPIRYDTKAIELLTNTKMEITGVRALTKDGLKDFKAKGGVIIATGGYHANKEMLTAYMAGWAADMPLRGSNIITGENVALTKPCGAKFVNMDQFHGGPIHGPTQANPSLAVNYGICVTKEGKRYVDENWTYVKIGKETAKQIPENWAFIILDEVAKKHPTVADRFERFARAKAPIYEDTDIAGLAAKAKINAGELVKTVKEYNDAVRAKKAAQLTPPNTQESPFLVATPKFYAFPFQGGMTATFGGPLINTTAQVVNTENKVIPGLYAVGNAAGGLFYWDYIGGAQLGAAVVFGRIAAADALARVKKG